MKNTGFDTTTRDMADFPFDAAPREQIKFLLRYAVLAPSGHNTQPWLFRIADDTVDLRADRTRALPVVDPYDRELVISCGAALANLEIAARRFGFDSDVALEPDPDDTDLLARVRLTGTTRPGPATHLFKAIPMRRTTRSNYLADVVPPDIIEACKTHAQAFETSLRVFDDDTSRRDIAALVDEGDRLQFNDPSFRRELASWVHSTRMGRRDGMSGTGFGMPDILAPLARFAIRSFDLGNGVAASDVNKIIEGSPMLGLLSSAQDQQTDWIETGRALQHVLLELTGHGFTASYLNPPVETPSLRPKLQELAGTDGFPQILLRMGRATHASAPSVRRALHDVIA